MTSGDATTGKTASTKRRNKASHSCLDERFPDGLALPFLYNPKGEGGDTITPFTVGNVNMESRCGCLLSK